MSKGSAALDHGRRYVAALLAYQEARGTAPDRNWRAMLYLLTTLTGLWEATQGHLDLAQGTVRLDPREFEHLSTSERALLALAINLFSGRGAVNVARLIGCLDSISWPAAIRAIHLYRELPAGWCPKPEPPALPSPAQGQQRRP